MAEGVWTDNGIVLLEDGELNRKKVYKFLSEAQASRAAKSFPIQKGHIVKFEPGKKNGEDVAENVEPTGRPYRRRKD